MLRRIIRRALRHGNKLGMTEPFFYKLVPTLAADMGEAYPELVKAKTHIEKTLRHEEEQFSLTLSQGLKLFDQAVAELHSKLKDKSGRVAQLAGRPGEATRGAGEPRGENGQCSGGNQSPYGCEGANRIAMQVSPVPDFEENGRIIIFGGIGYALLLGSSVWLGAWMGKSRR